MPRIFGPPVRLAVAFTIASGVLAVAPAIASANVPLPQTVSLPVDVVASLGGWSDGVSTMTVTYTDTTATATASSLSVGLGPGHVFHIDTCIKVVTPSSFNTPCQEKTIDTTGNTGPIAVGAPTATASMPRPASGSAYFSYIVSISTQQPDSSFTTVASSWPSSGLAGASVAVPVLNSVNGTTPASQGMLLTNNVTGGINTGQPDSFCEDFQYPQPAPPGAGISTSSMGSGAPAYYEVGDPTGAYLGQPPIGVMLIVHGGGWFMTGPAMVATERSEADWWRGQGWETVNVDYRPCNQSFADVKWFYDQARQVFGTTVPYCALGGSAGGDLALMLAAARPSVNCVISEAGPTDGLTIRNESTPTGSTNGPRWVYNLLTAAVGQPSVVWWSPAIFPIHARVLWAVAAGDPYIPWAQGTELQSKMLSADPSAYVDLLQLASGSTPWVHASVSPAALTTFQAHEQQLVAPLTG